MNNLINISILEASPAYELIDSGDGEKLERFGDVVLSRPDPQALWHKHSPDIWKKAIGTFTRDEAKGEWSLTSSVPPKWNISFAGLTLGIKPTPFKHVGLFPEQAVNWGWMEDKIRNSKSEILKNNSATPETVGDIEVLNLFAYTGGATLACAKAGAKVVHVDGSKAAVTWARENAESSGLGDKPIRWILDDVRDFVRREIKRGRKYHGIIMDPPAFGHGADKQVWKIEQDFLDLISSCEELLAPDALFFIINGYSAGYSSIAYRNALESIVSVHGGSIDIGELAIKETQGGRLLPCGIYARWSK